MRAVASDRAIGLHRTELTTPALVLDLDAASRNIQTMATAAAALGIAVRPHVKAHKCVPLAQLQLDAGSIGLTCATVSELEQMCGTDVRELLLANEIVDPRTLHRLAEAARDRSVTVAVDDAEHVALAAAAAAHANASIGVVIEVDLGMQRAGVRTPSAAAELAAAAARTSHLSVRGVHGYEGHCVMIDDASRRKIAAEAAVDRLAGAAEAVAAAVGTCDVVTTGGTATFPVSGAHPAVTDVQAGSYVLMDAFHERLLPGMFESAVRVVGSIISRHGTRAIVDAGRKAISVDVAAPEFPTLEGVDDATFHEEHCVVDVPTTPRLGERIDVMPGYAPTTVSLYDVFHVVRDDVVVDLWPIGRR